MSEPAAATRVALWLGRVVAGSASVFHGWDVAISGQPSEAQLSQINEEIDIEGALAGARSAAEAVGGATETLDARMRADADDEALRAAVADFGVALARYFDAVGSLGEELEKATSLLSGGDGQVADELVGGFVKRVVDYVVLGTLGRRVPELVFCLQLVGLCEPGGPSGDQPGQSSGVALHLDRLGALLSDPVTHFRRALGWGTEDFNPLGLFYTYQGLFREDVHIEIDKDTEGEPYLRHGSVTVRRAETLDGQPPGVDVDLADGIELDYDQRVALNDAWDVTVVGDLSLDAGATVGIAPLLDLTLQAVSTAASGGMNLSVSRNPQAGPLSVLATKLLTVEVGDVVAGISLKVEEDQNASPAKLRAVPFVRVQEATLRLGLSGADGFVASVLPEDLVVEFDLAATFDEHGLTIDGGVGLKIAVASTLRLGALTVDRVDLIVPVGDAGLGFQARANARLGLGPATVAVDGVGVGAEIASKEAQGSNVGPFDVGVQFLPPRGLGLAIDTAAVRGGGSLAFDAEAGRYSGAVSLRLGDLSIGAVGLLTMPSDGGWSLVVVVTAEFPPIQLGFGFELHALGGILGVHRRADVDVLRDGVAEGMLTDVFFPDDPVGRAPQLIARLEAAFPAREGQYVFGPSARLAWGAPVMVTLDVALALELPAPVRLLIAGRLEARAPRPEQPLVALNMDVLGVIDFTAKRAAVDARLHDSHIGPYSVSGEMALRTAWGEQADFALSVGGLHPEFRAPPEFPHLDRLVVAIGDGNNPRLRASGYVALTSNTVQFGAKLEVHASQSGFSVDASLSFDALVQLAPFRFVVSIRGKASLKYRGDTLFGVDLHLQRLAGPSPWHAKGYAKFEFCWIDYTVDFDARFGVGPGEPPPPPAIWPELRDALADPRAWATQTPEGGHGVVELADTGQDAPLLHPLAPAAVRQHVVPLATPVERFAGRPLETPQRFAITDVTVGTDGPAVTTAEVADRFAPAAFLALSEAEKLSAEPFERYPAGVAVRADGTEDPAPVSVPVGFEEIVVDAPDGDEPGLVDVALMVLADDLETAHSVGPGPRHHRFGVDGPKVAVGDVGHRVVDAATLTPSPTHSGLTTFADARSAARDDASLAVVPAHVAAGDT